MFQILQYYIEEYYRKLYQMYSKKNNENTIRFIGRGIINYQNKSYRYCVLEYFKNSRSLAEYAPLILYLLLFELIFLLILIEFQMFFLEKDEEYIQLVILNF